MIKMEKISRATSSCVTFQCNSYILMVFLLLSLLVTKTFTHFFNSNIFFHNYVSVYNSYQWSGPSPSLRLINGFGMNSTPSLWGCPKSHYQIMNFCWVFGTVSWGCCYLVTKLALLLSLILLFCCTPCASKFENIHFSGKWIKFSSFLSWSLEEDQESGASSLLILKFQI